MFTLVEGADKLIIRDILECEKLPASLGWPIAVTLLISFLSVTCGGHSAPHLTDQAGFLSVDAYNFAPFPSDQEQMRGSKMAQQMSVPAVIHEDLISVPETHRGQKEPVLKSCPLTSLYPYTLNKNKQTNVTTIIKSR